MTTGRGKLTINEDQEALETPDRVVAAAADQEPPVKKRRLSKKQKIMEAKIESYTRAMKEYLAGGW